jgi:hypothetical protein
MGMYPLKMNILCKWCGNNIIARRSSDNVPRRIFCSYKCRNIYRNKNIPQTEKQRKMSSERMKTLCKRERPIEERLRASITRRGNKCHFWKGGISPINKRIREGVEYKLWREAVFKRDNWTCQECKTRGGKLNAHHIKSFALFKEFRFDVNNGLTLCLSCHKKTDNYAKIK